MSIGLDSWDPKVERGSGDEAMFEFLVHPPPGGI